MMTYRIAVLAIALGGLSCSALGSGETSASPQAETIQPYAQRPPQDEVIYFLLPDRFENGDKSNDKGGIAGGRLDTGFDPTSKGFFHGGDLAGLTQRLDYIQGMGVTAIWLAPIYQNKAVQGAPGSESAGYHGYWITDFTKVDSHFGTKDDMRAFVDAAHARGMKVYLDIVINHTADVIQYRECQVSNTDPNSAANRSCPYRNKANYPFATKGRFDGTAINDGFMGDQAPFQSKSNFDKLTNMDFAYTPYIPDGEENVKVPAWLNDLRYYHNRGNSSFEGESSNYGDFSGLDDVMTENPRVVQGFIDIFKQWISDYRIDGFRVDTARHVNPEFWRAFIPAMRQHAASLGIPNFYIFAEAAEPNPGGLARFTRVDGFPAVLDFAFQETARAVFVDGEGTARLAALFAGDALYQGGEAMARRLPTFLGNHDRGRFSWLLRRSDPNMPDDVMFARLRAANALMFFTRGVPVIYSGDEQGFVGDGIDQDAREDMFPSKVAIYNDNDLVATDKTTADSNFDTQHPLYKDIAHMARLKREHPALRDGRQILRLTEKDGGLFAFSRILTGGEEYLVVINARAEPRQVQIEVSPLSQNFESLYGTCAPSVSARSSYPVTIDGFGIQVCRAISQGTPQ
jgi:neopullulanase